MTRKYQTDCILPDYGLFSFLRTHDIIPKSLNISTVSTASETLQTKTNEPMDIQYIAPGSLF